MVTGRRALNSTVTTIVQQQHLKYQEPKRLLVYKPSRTLVSKTRSHQLTMPLSEAEKAQSPSLQVSESSKNQACLFTLHCALQPFTLLQ